MPASLPPPPSSRSEVERSLAALLDPLQAYASPGGAGVHLGGPGAFFGRESTGLEGLLRPLWGIVPWLMGGGSYPHLERLQRGLAHGSDPQHPEYWGGTGTDQRMVERAALGFALAYLPEHFWEPFAPGERERLGRWLRHIDGSRLPDSNWHFFRILADLGLERVGFGFDPKPHAESLAAIERHYLGDGYYSDGPASRIDYYAAWAYHTYGLIYAHSPVADPVVAKRYVARARAFAERFQYWFDETGRAIPFGRSQTYRFAQVAFFSALAFAGVEALPYARLKGLILRNLRQWFDRPIFDRDGVLSLGYGYPNLHICEPYNSPCSPYWACKAYLALALPADHAFWLAGEEPPEAFAASLEPLRAESRAAMLFQHTRRHAVMLSGGQSEPKYPNMPARYGKFAYSSHFGFSVAVVESNPHHGVHDSMLALRDPRGQWFVREQTELCRIEGGILLCRWRPRHGVRIDTALGFAAEGIHLRLHRLEITCPLVSMEQGFALGRDTHDDDRITLAPVHGRRGLLASTLHGTAGIVDLDLPSRFAASRPRTPQLIRPLPNTSLMWPRTVIPSLAGEHPPGVHYLACAVVGLPEPRDPVPVPALAQELCDRLEAFSRS